MNLHLSSKYTRNIGSRCVLSEPGGFTDEETDFIINYDIKYRMGKGGDEGDTE